MQSLLLLASAARMTCHPLPPPCCPALLLRLRAEGEGPEQAQGGRRTEEVHQEQAPRRRQARQGLKGSHAAASPARPKQRSLKGLSCSSTGAGCTPAASAAAWSCSRHLIMSGTEADPAAVIFIE